MEQLYPETTLRDYVRVIFRHKITILTCFITVMATVAIGLQFKTPVYQAQVKLLISAEKQVDSPYYRQLMGYRNGEVALTQSEIVKSSPVIERAVQATRLYERPFDYEQRFCSALKKRLIQAQASRFKQKFERLSEERQKAYRFRMAVEELKRDIKVEPIRDTNLFTISAREFNPVGAAIIANVVSRSYIIFDLEQQLAELQLKYGEKHLSVTQLRDHIEKMQQGLSGEPLSNIEAIGPASVKIVEQAQIPMKPLGPSKYLTLLLALLMAPFLGIMLAFGFEYMDQTFRSPQDIETFLNLPVLGSIPRKGAKGTFLHNLAEQLYLLVSDKGLRALLFTSALPKEGTTTIVGNLAKYLSQKMNHKVLLIDANLRNPGLHQVFNIPQGPGLAEILEGKTSFGQAISKAISPPSPQRGEGKGEGATSHLHILPAGVTALNPTTLLNSSAMVELIKMAKQKYEIVLLDCANLKDFRDAALIASSLDAVALVIDQLRSRRQVVKAALFPLEQKNARLLGVILNKRTFVIPKIIYDRV